MLQALAAVSGAFFVVGWLGRYFWAADLFSHFRAQYAGTLLVCALGLFILKRRRPALWVLAAAVPVTFSLFAAGALRNPAAGDPLFRLVTYNVNTANTRFGDVNDFLESTDADVIFLMEINTEWIERLDRLGRRYPFRLAAPREDNFGLLMLSRLPFEGEVHAFGDFAIPWVDLTVVRGNVRILAVHTLPPSGAENSASRNLQLLSIASLAGDRPRTVLCGDLNLTPYSPWFPEILRAGRLHAAAPSIDPTWMRRSPLFALPIDQVLLTGDLTVTSRTVGPSLGSDHNPVTVDLAERADRSRGK